MGDLHDLRVSKNGDVKFRCFLGFIIEPEKWGNSFYVSYWLFGQSAGFSFSLNHLIVHLFFVSDLIGTTNQEADPGYSGPRFCESRPFLGGV